VSHEAHLDFGFTGPSKWALSFCLWLLCSKVVQISYSRGMDHLLVLREKIGQLREEIADIQRLNDESRRDGGKGTDAQVARRQRNERLQAIQQELVRLADLSRKVISTEQMREKHRSRLHGIKH